MSDVLIAAEAPPIGASVAQVHAAGLAFAARRRRKRAPEPMERRTFQEVRRDSQLAGGPWEDAWRNGVDQAQREDLAKIPRAARAFEKKHKRPGQRYGPLGRIAIELLDELCGMIRAGMSSIYFSVDELAEKLRCSASAIHAAKQALQAHGFLDWARRLVVVDGAGHDRGPQVKQTSNLYKLALPKAARVLLGALGRAPRPADETVRRRAVEAQFETYERQAFLDRLHESPIIAAASAKAAAILAKPERDSS